MTIPITWTNSRRERWFPAIRRQWEPFAGKLRGWVIAQAQATGLCERTVWRRLARGEYQPTVSRTNRRVCEVRA